MLEDRISKLRSLIATRDEIDAELALLVGVQPKKPRGRPPKPESFPDQGNQDTQPGI